MAGPTKPRLHREIPPSPHDPRGLDKPVHVVDGEPPAKTRHEQVREAAAKLYGQGFERKQVAEILLDHLVPNKEFQDGTPRPKEQRMSQARSRLRAWEARQDFRDLIYNTSVVALDLQTPKILGGIAKKARTGRVDAARLALELTGRHNPKGDDKPAQIVVAIAGVPRPAATEPQADLELEQAEDGTFIVKDEG